MNRQQTIEQIYKLLGTGAFPSCFVNLLREVIETKNPTDYFVDSIFRRMKEALEFVKQYEYGND